MTSLVDHQCVHVCILNLKRSRTYILEKYQDYCIDPAIGRRWHLCLPKGITIVHKGLLKGDNLIWYYAILR
jgi:hypothetical protein